jgi:hypothetical protein
MIWRLHLYHDLWEFGSLQPSNLQGIVVRHHYHMTILQSEAMRVDKDPVVPARMGLDPSLFNPLPTSSDVFSTGLPNEINGIEPVQSTPPLPLPAASVYPAIC